MKSCGISDIVLSWFKSYFTRTQVVKIGNTISNPLSVSTGIGQCNILRPLVFYINDVMNSVGNFRENMFADNRLIYKIGNTRETMVPKIQEGVDCFSSLVF